ncbi:MAG: potassium channel protein [Phycisphaerae bacterium]
MRWLELSFVSARLRLILSILAVLSVLFVGAAGYMILEAERHPTFLDALYMMVITLSTVGYGEVWALNGPAKLWTIAVITFGIVTVSYAFTSLLTLVVSGELRSLRERKRMDKTIEHLRDHVILCGYGRMGALIVDELRQRDVPIVVVEKERTLEVDLREGQVPFVIGDATEEETLLHAGLKRAEALVIALPSDADNVFITLTAHTLCPDLTIVARAEQVSTEAKLTRAGATRVVCPQVIGAIKVANILTRPTVVDFMEVASKGVDLELDEYEIGEQSPLVGRSLRDSGVRRKTGAIVVAIKRADGEALVGPNPDAHLEARDTLILVGPAGVSSRLDEIETGD